MQENERLPQFSRAGGLAKFLGISPKTLAEWRMEGRGPKFIRASKRMILYRDVDVQQWLAARNRNSTNEIII